MAVTPHRLTDFEHQAKDVQRPDHAGRHAAWVTVAAFTVPGEQIVAGSDRIAELPQDFFANQQTRLRDGFLHTLTLQTLNRISMPRLSWHVSPPVILTGPPTGV